MLSFIRNVLNEFYRAGQVSPVTHSIQTVSNHLPSIKYILITSWSVTRVTPGIRRAKKDTIVPFSSPIRNNNGQDQHEVLITEGAIVVIGMQATNRHRGLWGDDADEWRPDRWLSPLPQAVIDARIPGVYSHL